jgi:hypothetical protein
MEFPEAFAYAEKLIESLKRKGYSIKGSMTKEASVYDPDVWMDEGWLFASRAKPGVFIYEKDLEVILADSDMGV